MITQILMDRAGRLLAELIKAQSGSPEPNEDQGKGAIKFAKDMGLIDAELAARFAMHLDEAVSRRRKELCEERIQRILDEADGRKAA